MIDPVKRWDELIASRPHNLDAHAAWVSTINQLASEIRREAMQECAEICDEYSKRKFNAASKLSDKERFESSDNALTRSVGAREAANAIRARMEKP